MNIYFDMDGTLAKWRNVSFEETFEENYFRDLEPEENLIKVVKMLVEDGHDVQILTSAAPLERIRSDKMSWLKKQGLDDLPVVFVDYGDNKIDYVPAFETCYLVDDYSKNLHEWESGGHIGIKWYNRFNGNHGTWRGYMLSERMDASTIYDTIVGVTKA